MSKLQKLRMRKSLSQSQLAERADVKLSTIQAWEQRGSNQDTLKRIARICGALGCSVEDLID